MSESLDMFPLFPLGIVLLPQEVVPLHIFEERYKLMIGECLERESEFGVVWLADDGLCDVGCTARITQVLDRFEDGRLNILVSGGSPFRLTRKIEELPYPAGDVDLLEDDPEDDSDVADEARERYAELVEQVTDERPDAEDLAELDAYGMAATIEFDAKAKQELLELRSEDARLRRVAKLFGTTLKRLAESEHAEELARSNGKLHFSV